MPESDPHRTIIDNGPVYDVVIVGASLAGCATAIQLGRAGQQVAVIEKQPDPKAFKRMCSHFIQASGVPAIERLGLLEQIEAAGGLRPRMHAWTRWGWIEAPPEQAGRGLNLRREVLDPMIRSVAAETPGVEMMLGWKAEAMLRNGEAFAGVAVVNTQGEERQLRSQLTIGADGRDSKVVELAELREKTLPHNRFAYGGYFEGPAPKHAPDATIWMMDPQWAAVFPTDSNLYFYAAMPTKDRLPEFKRDPEAALVDFLSIVPEPPPIRESRAIEPVMGKIDMTNRVRQTVAPGLALVGDAALAADPLFGVGCGWAFQSAEWLSDSVLPALQDAEPLEQGLDRYRRRHARELKGHAFFVNDYATGRKLNPAERLTFSAAARDPKAAGLFDAFGTRQIRPQEFMPRMIPRAVAVNARHALAR
jgi:2-polyprenyl-6-methoxyphenol hydroxylase-like FAD-dependent oxidoreductase